MSISPFYIFIQAGILYNTDLLQIFRYMDTCTNVTRDPKREYKQLIYNILHKSLNRNFGKYISSVLRKWSTCVP